MGAASSPMGVAATLMGNSAPPTVAVQPAAGSTATAQVEGSNIAGKITLNISGLGIAIGKVMTMTFSGTPPFPNGAAIVFTAGNAAFASVQGMLYAQAGKTSVDLFVSGLALGTGTYIGYYQVIGY